VIPTNVGSGGFVHFRAQPGKAPTMTDPAFGRIQAVADHCGVSPRTVRRWLDAGLPHYKPDPSPQGVVLIKWADLDRWLSERGS
jgi:hypothetical protein